MVVGTRLAKENKEWFVVGSSLVFLNRTRPVNMRTMFVLFYFLPISESLHAQIKLF